MDNSKSFSTTVLAVLACVLWSTAFVGVKIGLQHHTPMQFAGIRFFISGLLILPFTGNLKATFREFKSNYKFILSVGFLQTTVQYTCFYIGLSYVPAALAALLIGASPLFIAVLSHFYMQNDRMSSVKLMSILVGVTGIGIISFSNKGGEFTNNLLWLGIILLLINNIISGISNLIIAKNKSSKRPLVISSFSLTFGGLLLMIFSVPFEGVKFSGFPQEYYIALAWLSFLSACAISIWFMLLRRPGIKVSTLNFWKFIIPVLGAVISWIIMPDEYPNMMSLVGMVCIAASLLILNYSNRMRDKGVKLKLRSIRIRK